MQSVCDNTVVNCDETVKNKSLLLFICKDIHINFLHSESSNKLIDLNQKY